MRIEWTLFAMNDREAIFDYLEADSPRAAILIDDRIEAQVELLMKRPRSGVRAGSKEPASWSSRERLILQPTELNARPSRSCAFCMALKSGRRRWSPGGETEKDSAI